MKIMITGAGGQLSHDLIRVLSPVHDVYAYSKQALDITDFAQMQQQMQSLRPDAVIHGAAYTKVDQAESEPYTVFRVNAIGTRNVAVCARAVNAKLVYISSDYVFDGKKDTPYTEWDQPKPISVYGTSKYAGEQMVRSFHDKYYVLRTAWLYGIHGHNFVKTMLNLATKQSAIYGAIDQFGSPTYCRDLALFIRSLLETELYGLYHAANLGSCSRYEFAEAILQASGVRDIQVVKTEMSSFELKASRPRNTSLDDWAIRMSGLPRFRDWREALLHFIEQEWRSQGEMKTK